MKKLIILAIIMIGSFNLEAAHKRKYIDVDELYMNRGIMYWTNGKRSFKVKALRFGRKGIYVLTKDLLPFPRPYIRYPTLCDIK